MTTRLLHSAVCSGVFAFLSVGCASRHSTACDGYHRELTALTEATKADAQTWHDIDELQKSVAREMYLRAKVAADCPASS